MIQIIIWFAALLCPNPSHTIANHGNCTLIHMPTGTANPSFGEGGDDGGDGGDTGGETGGQPHPHPHLPPPPPPPAP